MQLTILGTANAWGPNPFDLNWNLELLEGQLSNGRSLRFRQYCTSLLVRSEHGDPILVDCGPDFARQVWEFRIERLAAVLLTHSHWDHIAGLDFLHLYRSAPYVRDRKPHIPVYATQPCWNDIYTRRDFAYLVNNHIVEYRNIIPGQSFFLEGLKITPFSVLHGDSAPGAVGFVFEEQSNSQTSDLDNQPPSPIRSTSIVEDEQSRPVRVLYSGDFYQFVSPRHEFFRCPFDLVVLECSQWTPRRNGHISFLEILDLLTNGCLAHASIRQLTLIHFSEYGPCGPCSTYQDWRNAVTSELYASNLSHIVADKDALIAYEGLTFHFPVTSSRHVSAPHPDLVQANLDTSADY